MYAWLAAVVTHPAFLVSVGGAAGANARFWLGEWVKGHPWARDFFWGTLIINVSGSALLGLVAVLCKPTHSVGYLLLGTGFCGGYTTFSTFSLEVLRLLERGDWPAALAYVAASVLGGFIGVALVVWAAGKIGPP